MEKINFNGKWRRVLFFVLAVLSWGGNIYWVLRIPPSNPQRIAVFFLLIFTGIFFLCLGIFGRLKIALWLGLWAVILLLLRYKQAGLMAAFLISLVLWGVVKITP